RMSRERRASACSWMRPTPHPDVRSRRPMQPHSAIESTTHWMAWNLMIERLMQESFGSRSRGLRYEDFVPAPGETVESLFRFTGTPLTTGPFENHATVRLPGNHTVSG